MYLLCYSFSEKSAKLLAEALDCKCTQQDVEERDVLIRWGTARAVQYRAAKVLNKRASIETCVDKLKTLQVLKEANVSVPLFWESYTAATYPCIFRIREHTQGNGFYVACYQEEGRVLQQNCSGYFLKMLSKQEEYRIFVVKDEIVLRYIKEREKPDADPLIRNEYHGWRMRRVDSLPEQLEELAKRAVSALNLDFGAVDLVKDPENNYYVLEVNSAPELNPFRATRLAQALIRQFDL